MKNENQNAPDNKSLEGLFMSSLKVGIKGQIVIPKEVRDLFGIQPGDQLLLLADVNRGIAIHTQHQEVFHRFANEIFRPDKNQEDSEE